MVNAADFVVLSNHFGLTGTGWAAADFNGDDRTDAADFVILSNHFGYNTQVLRSDWQALMDFAAAHGIDEAAVPEPAAAGLLALLGAGALLGRRGRARATTSHV